MIFDSYYWKRDLLKLSRKLKKRKSQDFFIDSTYGEFEKEIMIGFYILRKLKDSYKLSNATIATNITGRKIPNKGKIVHLMNIHNYEECFNFSKAINTKFDVIFLINQFIHSYVFSAYFFDPIENPSFGLAGIHFCSEKNRNQWLYEIDIDTVILLFNKAGTDYPTEMRITFDKNKQDYKIFQLNDVSQIDRNPTLKADSKSTK